eukprot:scaffold8361_cov118-Isochrysis_galbana.AAC.6
MLGWYGEWGAVTRDADYGGAPVCWQQMGNGKWSLRRCTPVGRRIALRTGVRSCIQPLPRGHGGTSDPGRAMSTTCAQRRT